MQKIKILITGASGDLGRVMVLYLSTFKKFEIYAADSQIDLLAAAPSSKRYLLPKADTLEYIQELNQLLEKNHIDILWLGSDLEIRRVTQDKDNISAKFWYPPHKAIVTMQNKFLCNQLWQSKNVAVPNSIVIKEPSQLKPDVWLRPVDHIGGGGKLAVHAITKIQAKQWLDQHHGWGKFTMSEFLPGVMFGFDSLWKNGKLLSFSIKERVRYSRDSSISFTTSVVKTSSNQQAIKMAIKAIKTILPHPDGVFSVDLRENSQGIPCVTEINPGRFLTTSILLFKELSYDLPLDYLNLILGKKIPVRKQIRENQYLFFVKGLIRVVDEKDMLVENARRYWK